MHGELESWLADCRVPKKPAQMPGLINRGRQLVSPSVSLALPPVGVHSTAEQLLHTTTLWEWLNTVVLHTAADRSENCTNRHITYMARIQHLERLQSRLNATAKEQACEMSAQKG